MVYESKLPYGLRIDGDKEKLLHISEILPHESGLKCRCVCPNCGEQLQAKLPRTNENFTPRFAHHNSDTCDHATETAIHMKAKEIIEQAKHMLLPRIIASHKDLTTEVSSEKEILFDKVILERRLNNIIPDILAYKNSRPLIIEIKITHGVDDIKLEKIRDMGISTLEIDLSEMRTNFDPDFLYNEIILNTRNKVWVYNSKQEQEVKNLKEKYLLALKEQQETRLKTEERKRRQAKLNDINRTSKAARVTQILEGSNQEKLKETWRKQIQYNSIWNIISAKMGITIHNIPEYINVKIPGEVVFGCDRRVWQAYIFYNYIYDKVRVYQDTTYFVKVQRIQENMKKAFKKYLISDLIYLQDLDAYQNFPDLTKVIYAYLKQLERLGYLTEHRAGHIFYTEFLVLDPNHVREMRYISKTMEEYKMIEDLIKKKAWGECIELVIDLLIKYSERNERKFYHDLEHLYNRLVLLHRYKSKK